jgi:hypothetical protein
MQRGPIHDATPDAPFTMAQISKQPTTEIFPAFPTRNVISSSCAAGQQVCVTRVDHAACRVGDRGCLLLSRCAVTTSPLSDKPPQTHLRHRTPDVTAQEYMQPDNSHPSEASETSRGFGSRRGHTLCSVSDAVLPLSGLFPFAPHIRAGRLPGCVTQGRPSVGK